jgi:hypothetical protein
VLWRDSGRCECDCGAADQFASRRRPNCHLLKFYSTESCTAFGLRTLSPHTSVVVSFCCMDFSHSNIDARQSAFNQVGRDQWNQYTVHIHRQTVINIGQGQTHYHFPDNLSHVLPRPVSGPETLPQRYVSTTTYCSSDTLPIVDPSISLIIQITNRLINHNDSSNHQILQLQLRSLQQILTLTGLAIHEYCDTPLGQSLAKTMAPEVERCFLALQELLDQVNATWLGLAGIGDLWRQVWRGRWDGDEFNLLRRKLFHSRQSLERFLMELHSYVLFLFFCVLTTR